MWRPRPRLENRRSCPRTVIDGSVETFVLAINQILRQQCRFCEGLDIGYGEPERQLRENFSWPRPD